MTKEGAVHAAPLNLFYFNIHFHGAFHDVSLFLCTDLLHFPNCHSLNYRLRNRCFLNCCFLNCRFSNYHSMTCHDDISCMS